MLLGAWKRMYNVGVCKVATSEWKKPWKEAASLIVAAPSNKSSGIYATDYQILFLKRSSKSKFYPNAYVYPGGIVDEADKHPKWIEIFSKIDPFFCENISKEFFAKQSERKRPSLFPADEKSLKNGILPNEIAFRICAIRESFEESGILLLTNDVRSRRNNPDELHAMSVTSLLGEHAVEEWRRRVHSNAMEFMNLCLELQQVPDIWSLKEWFQWLTPVTSTLKSRRRYDTVFYSCCMKEAPSYSYHDEVETTESIWISPAEMLQLFVQKKAFLAPPQMFETLRLLNFRDLRSLASYTHERALKGLQRWMPHFVATKDGKLLDVMPGDDRYPDDIDEYGTEELNMVTLDKTHSEIMASSGNHFNFLFQGDPAYKLSTMMCNVTMKHGQIGPVIVRNPGDLVAKL